MNLSGIHHLIAVSADIRENYRFYMWVLGMRLVKRSVNQDDVGAYHLFYACFTQTLPARRAPTAPASPWTKLRQRWAKKLSCPRSWSHAEGAILANLQPLG